MLKWALPLPDWAHGLVLKEKYTVKGLLDGLKDLGRNVSAARYAVINFFRTLFGHLPLETVEGSYMEGLYALLALAGLGLLILLYGAVRNSATRYIWAVANREDRSVRREIRRRLRGRRCAPAGNGAVQSAAVRSLPVDRRFAAEGYLPESDPAAGADHDVERTDPARPGYA